MCMDSQRREVNMKGRMGRKGKKGEWAERGKWENGRNKAKKENLNVIG